MRQQILATTAAVSLACGLGNVASAATLELALVIDGSSSISADDWDLQIGAYQSIFQDNFYTGFVAAGPFDDIHVAAYVFSGFVTDFPDAPPEFSDFFAVLDFIDWRLIDSDAAASEFGAEFADLQQPGGQTATAAALEIATQGGTVGCPVGLTLNEFVCTGQVEAQGLLNNGIDAGRLVIDISTDGVPTLPNGEGTPNEADDELAQAAASAARASGIIVNAIGVGGVDAAFLSALVGQNPAESPEGFFLTADTFATFEDTLRDKLNTEINVIPVPAALPLFLSALAGLGLWRRRAH